MGKGRVLRIYENKALLENLDAPSGASGPGGSVAGPNLLITQEKDTGLRLLERIDKANLADLGSTAQVLPFEAIFGFYDLLSGSYIALVVESEPYVTTPLLTMRRAKKIVVVPLFRSGRALSDSKQKDEDRYLQLLNLAFSEHHFFFSYTHDITLTQQRLAKLTPDQRADPLWKRADFRFFWNRDVIDDLTKIDADDWIVPFMSGYVELRQAVAVDDIKIDLLFLSRRSKYRQGCRFTKRGIDDNGHTANFVETEQVLVFPDGKLTSYVQIRGSIPLKWISPVHMRYDPAVFIEPDTNKSIDCCNVHIKEVLDKYSDNAGNANLIMINLIDNKRDQGRLGVAYKDVIDSVRPYFKDSNTLRYTWFDFHHECKQKGKWNNLGKLVMLEDDAFRKQGYFCKLPNGQVTQWQTGVIRTNCMDNLDRTNVVQSLFARRSLVLQLGKEKTIDFNGKHIMDTPWKTFEKVFKTIWTNNADAMSMGYAGTGALKTDFTKTGKRTLKGMMNDGVNSVMRYYINNFTDGVKQDAIDLMLGRYRPDPFGASPFTQATSQEVITSNATKAFVLVILLFSSFMVLIPPMIPLHHVLALLGQRTGAVNESLDEIAYSPVDRAMQHLQMLFFIALAVSFVVSAYLGYKIMKKGSKIGEKLVTLPELCPEPLPPGRSPK